MFDFIKNIGPTEIIVIAVILVLIFGAKMITGLARTSGQTVKEIKKIKKEFTNAINEDDSKS
jgi:sec-independent protein translocase protein TatA